VLPYLGNALVQHSGWELIFTVGMATGAQKPLLILTPILAEMLARAGLSKYSVQTLLWQQARITARQFERLIGEWTNLAPGHPRLVDLVARGRAARLYAESDDPDRLVPIVARPEDIMIAVSGDPLRTNAYVFAHNGILGYPTTRAVIR